MLTGGDWCNSSLRLAFIGSHTGLEELQDKDGSGITSQNFLFTSWTLYRESRAVDILLSLSTDLSLLNSARVHICEFALLGIQYKRDALHLPLR
jgi:hypothetical protein